MQKKKIPKVSIIIPAYNQGFYLEHSLNSVFNQTFKGWECIIVNDGSIDNTASIAKKYVKNDKRFTYVYQKNEGLSGARNTGIEEAKGEYIGFLDSDDLLHPKMLEKTISYLEKNQDIAVVSGAWDYIDETGKIISQKNGPAKSENYLRDLIHGNLFPVHASLLKKEIFSRCGLFDTSLHSSEDWDIWLRVARRDYKFGYINDLVAHYRVHKDSMTMDIQRIRNSNFSVLDKFFKNNPELNNLKSSAYTIQWIHLAESFMRIGNIKELHECLKQAEKISLNNKLIKPCYKKYECLSKDLFKAQVLYEKKYFVIPIVFNLGFFQRKINEKINDSFYIYCLARYYEKIGKIKHANKLYLNLLKKEKSNHYIRLLLARTYLNLGNIFYAMRQLKKIIILRNVSKDIKIHAKIIKGLCLYSQGKYKDALRIFNQLLRIVELDVMTKTIIKFHRGFIFYKKGYTNKAVDEFNSILNNNCKDGELKNNTILYLALSYRKRKDPVRVIRAFKQLLNKEIKEKTFCAQVHYHFGSALKKMGLLEDSKEEFKKVLKILSKKNGFQAKDFQSGAHFHLGTIFEKLGDKSLAEKKFKDCLRINPTHKAAQYELKVLSNF